MYFNMNVKSKSAIIYLSFLAIFSLLEEQCNCEEFYYSNDCESIDGEFGQCVPLKSCPLFMNFLIKRPIRKNNLRKLVQFTCKFDIEEPKVCCPVNDIREMEEAPENVVMNTKGHRQYNNNNNKEASLDYVPKVKIHVTGPNVYIENRLINRGSSNGYLYTPPLEHSFFRDRVSRRHPPPVMQNSPNLDISAETPPLAPQRNSQEDSEPLALSFTSNLKSHPNFKLIPDLQHCSNSFKLDRLAGTFGTYPWLALIGNKDPRTNKFQHVCTGSIINKRYILTSAYCAKETSKPQVIRVGEYNLDTDLDYGPESLPPLEITDYQIESVIPHSGYSKLTQENDIGLIRVSRDINFETPYIKPVCLPFAKEYEIEKRLLENDIGRLSGKLGWIIGWGRNNFGLTLKDRILEENTVPIISNEECSMKTRSMSMFTNSNTQFCAGGRRRRTPCVSDRGGPFLFPAKIPSGVNGIDGPKFFQLGISLQDSKSCPDSGFPLPTVYTKISSYLEWILNNIAET